MTLLGNSWPDCFQESDEFTVQLPQWKSQVWSLVILLGKHVEESVGTQNVQDLDVGKFVLNAGQMK